MLNLTTASVLLLASMEEKTILQNKTLSACHICVLIAMEALRQDHAYTGHVCLLLSQ